MATVRLKFRPSTTEGNEGTLFFQVIHQRVVRTVCTDYHIRPGEWNEASSSIHVCGTLERRAWLELVASRVRWDAMLLEAVIREKEAARAEYHADDVVAAYRNRPRCVTWFGFIRGMVERKTRIGRLGTAKTYGDALASFAKFRGGEDLALDSLGPEDINMYEAWMKGRGLKRNSSSCYLRTLRTLYRKAVEMGLTPDRDIFRHVFTGFAATAKRAVPLESVRAIRRLALDCGSPLAFARDVFMLSLYLHGMSFVDMAYLRKTDIRNGLLQYDRKKTRQTLTVGWEKPMQAIVDEYSHLTVGSPYLLPIITRQDGTERVQYERMEHKVNRYLKKIGEMAGVRIPLTTYVARHTWASTMRDIGCDLSIISKGLGHENLKTTQIYLSSIDTSAVTKANRRMISKIMK